MVPAIDVTSAVVSKSAALVFLTWSISLIS
jgi:hypothetical protein